MEAHAKENKPAAYPKNIHIVGTQTGKCQLCKETKKLLLLRYGFSLCEDCLSVCIGILEQLQNGVIEKELPITLHKKTGKKNSRKNTVRKTAYIKNAQASNKGT